jgi:hypothetical protein
MNLDLSFFYFSKKKWIKKTERTRKNGEEKKYFVDYSKPFSTHPHLSITHLDREYGKKHVRIRGEVYHQRKEDSVV